MKQNIFRALLTMTILLSACSKSPAPSAPPTPKPIDKAEVQRRIASLNARLDEYRNHLGDLQTCLAQPTDSDCQSLAEELNRADLRFQK